MRQYEAIEQEYTNGRLRFGKSLLDTKVLSDNVGYISIAKTIHFCLSSCKDIRRWLAPAGR